jgi:hypothetical protein
MKKTIYILTFVFLLISCSSSKTTGDGTPELSKKMLKGTWEVTNIRFVGEKGIYKSNLFDIADSACFKGSEWVFIPNNGSGKFTINSSSNCETSVNRIHWSFYEPGDGSYQFQFKFVDDKNKPLDAANRGYRANIEHFADGMMEMHVATTYEGNPFVVVMTFSIISDDITL